MRSPARVGGWLLLALLVSGAAQGPTDQRKRELVRAAILYQFVRATSWPEETFEDASAPIRVALLGDDLDAAILRGTFARGVDDRPDLPRRPVQLRAFPDGKPPEGESLARYHVVILAMHGAALRREVLKRLGDRPVLTVAEAGGFARQGGIIEVLQVQGEYRYQVNLKQARDRGLKFHSSMLRFARLVDAEERRR